MRKATSRIAWTTTIAAAALVFAGCSSSRSWLPRTASAAPATSRPPPSNVLIVRGTIGYWPDCENFVARLKGQGAEATLIRGWEINRTADKIAAARKTGGESRPLVLIGYSRGANDAIRLTRRLQEQGVAVDTLILMETAAQDSVPANVASCLNIYKSPSVAEEWVPAFRGLPVTVESAQTQLVNYNLRFHDDVTEEAVIDHFTVCQNPAVQGMIAERVALALQPTETRDDLPEAQLAGGPWGSDRTSRSVEE